MRKFRPSWLLLSVLSIPAQAEIWECIDRDGNKRFTNVKSEAAGCRPMNLPPLSTIPAPNPAATPGKPAPPAAGSGDFPKVDPSVQQQRDNARRRILERELASEERLLDQARRELAEQEAVRLGSERNYQRVLERLEPFRRKVALHENNVSNLRKEISSLR